MSTKGLLWDMCVVEFSFLVWRLFLGQAALLKIQQYSAYLLLSICGKLCANNLLIGLKAGRKIY